MKKWIIIAIAVILCAALILIIIDKQNNETNIEPEVENVETVKVTSRSIKSEVMVDGFIEDDVVIIDYNTIQGKVKDIYVHKGQKIKTGDPLVRLDVRANTSEIDVQIKQVKASVDEIEVYKKHLARNKKNLQTARKNVLLSDEEKAEIDAQIKQINDQIEVYTTQVKGLDGQKYALYSARDYLTDNAKFLAPCCGIIDDITIVNGQDVVSEHYIKIKKNISPIVKIYVTEKYLDFIKNDTALKIMLNKKTYNAKVEKILDGGGDNILYPVKIKLETNEAIRNGLSISAYFIEYENKQAATIPNKAIISFNGETYVYKVVGSKAVKTKVVVGITEDDMTEIISGLSVSDQVIINGQFGIKDGAEVNCNAYSK